ncbi:hypothetical protein GJ496_004449 [Pomphorhynchus laevis]|nr:hypothetical protein GJ496_004449 [Pomphorhynchus laevis]
MTENHKLDKNSDHTVSASIMAKCHTEENLKFSKLYKFKNDDGRFKINEFEAKYESRRHLDENTTVDAFYRKRIPLKKAEQTNISIESKTDEEVLQITLENVDTDQKYFGNCVVRTSLVDLSSQSYLIKSDIKNPVSYFYENKPEDLLASVICPVISKVSKICKETQSLIWNEALVFNERISHLMDQDRSVFIVFEIMSYSDLKSLSKLATCESLSNVHCWAFLKLVSKCHDTNINRSLSLQLWRPKKYDLSKSHDHSLVELLTMGKKIKYPGTFQIKTASIILPAQMAPAIRSAYPVQPEHASLGKFEKEIASAHNNERRKVEKDENNINILPDSKPKFNFDLNVCWDRHFGSACTPANSEYHRLLVGDHGCKALKFSHDGLWIACAYTAFAFPQIDCLNLYYVPSLSIFCTLRGHTAAITSVKWAQSSKYICSCSRDCTVRIWRIHMADTIQMIPHLFKVLIHTADVMDAAFHPIYDKILISAGLDKEIKVWTLIPKKSAMILQIINEHYTGVACLDISRDGLYFASLGTNSSVYIWPISITSKLKNTDCALLWNYCKPVFIIKDEDIQHVTSITFRPHFNQLLISCANTNIKLFDIDSGFTIKQFDANPAKLTSRVVFCTCGRFVVAGADNGIAYLWNINTGNVIHSYDDLDIGCAIKSIDIHPKADIICFSSNGYKSDIVFYKLIPEKKHHTQDLLQSSDSIQTQSKHSGELNNCILQVQQQINLMNLIDKKRDFSERINLYNKLTSLEKHLTKSHDDKRIIEPWRLSPFARVQENKSD